MRALASASDVIPATHRRQLSPKAVERRQNRLHYRAQLATFLEELAAADLTGTSYRVILDTISRMLRRGSCTEAVGNEWVAQRLGVGRNAVSSAYAALEAAGFVRRVAVKHRGAPTRTRLINLSARLIDDGAGPAIHSTPGKDRGRASVLDQRGGAEAAEGAGDAASSLAGFAEMASVAAAPPVARAKEEGDRPKPQLKAVATPKPFSYDPATLQSMMDKVPAEVRLAASQSINGKAPAVDPSWSLTDNEIAQYLALVPKVEPVQLRRATTSAKVRALPGDNPTMMKALALAHPRLTRITGSKEAAAKLGDQIAFQVANGLGNGDIEAGVRAGISLVQKGRWTEPHTYHWFKETWDGTTARAFMMAALD